MLNPVGKFLRNIMTEHNEKSKDMAEKLGVKPIFMSAVCNGRKRCPDSWYEKIPEIYNLDEEKTSEWIGVVIYSNHNIKFLYDKIESDDDKNIVLSLANFINTMKPSQKKAIKNIMNNG